MNYDGPVQIYGSANPRSGHLQQSSVVTAGTAHYGQMTFNGGNPLAGSQMSGGRIVPSWAQPSPGGTDPGVVGSGGLNIPAERYYGTQRQADSAYDGDQGSSGAGGNLPAEIAPNGQVISTVMGMRSNERVHGQVHISKACLPYNHMIGRQMLLFMKVGSGGGIPSAKIGLSPQERAAQDTFPTVVTMPVVNFLAACSAIVGKPDMTPREFLSMWMPYGACISEEGTDTLRAQPGMVLGYSRRGPEQIKNVFGSDIEADTPLLLIVKKVIVPKYYILDPMGGSADYPADSLSRPLKTSALQILPWASSHKLFPSMEDLHYEDDSGTSMYGSVVRIGKIEHRTTPPDYASVLTAPYSTASTIACQDVAVFLDQPRIHHFS